ncbi:MAG: ketoacyl-ACP synthase III, partial [Deltaproteobacteria bacterium]
MRRLIYVSSVGGDLLVPANANRVAAGLGLARTCDCLDLSNACMGFLSAFDIAARSIATGIGPVGIVVVELGHRVITPEDPRPFLVFGDAVVAAVIERARDDEGVLASWLRNDGPAGGDVYMAHPVVTGQRETVHFTASSLRMGTDAIGYLREAADAVLGETGLSLAEIEWVLPHQPNGPLLDAIIESLHVPAERVVRMVHDVGSVAAASIPVSLHRLLSSRRVRPGDR